MTTLEVLFTPADFGALKQRELSATVCVVFDILRATSTMVTALGHGAAGIIPVEEIPEALALRERHPGLLLAGEREGVRIGAHVTGSIAFDLGNSPREFTRDKVEGRTIAITTTNGTRALRACAHAKRVLVGAFLNLGATARFIEKERPVNVLLVCGGTHDQAAYEDVLAAGGLCELLWNTYSHGAVADSALMARRLYRLEEQQLLAAFAQSRNGRRLLAMPELKDDVGYCVRFNTLALVAEMGRDGVVRRSATATPL